MSNGQDINERLEFEDHIVELQRKGIRLDHWMAEQIFYVSKKLDKADKRLIAVEDNCRRAICDRSSGEPVLTPRMKRWAYGLGVPSGAVAIGYFIIELVKVIKG